MKKLLFLSILALFVSPALATAQVGHEYSPLVEKTVNYKNWQLPNLKTDKPEDLRKLIAGKKLVMVVYFAPWCGNWKNEAPIAAKLYEKYKDQGSV
jgi:thiol-disulfide isomerase/thioredoxin